MTLKRQSSKRAESSQLPAAQAVCLAGMVDYAEGSVVSRVILSNEAGSLTLFAFDEGQTISEHSVPHHAVVQVLDGRAELAIGGQVVQVGAGELALMPANVPHAVKAAHRFKMLLTMLRS
jgi:quercetin dioxygenase-like cupin family protein